MPRGGESPAVLAKRKEDHEKRIERNADIMRSSKLLLKPDPKLKEIMDGNTLTVDRSSGHPRDTGLAKVVWASASSNARSQGFAGLTGFQRGQQLHQMAHILHNCAIDSLDHFSFEIVVGNVDTVCEHIG